METRDEKPPLALVTDVARVVAAGAMVGAAMIHFAYAPPHFDHAVSHGTFFVVAGWLQLILAGGLGLRLQPLRVWLTATAVVNSAFVALWVVSRTAGIPGEDAEPAAFPDILATALEVVAVLASLALVLNLLVDRPIKRRPVFGAGAAAALATMALVSMSVAPSFAGTHDHDDDAGHDHEGESAAAHEHSDLQNDDHGHDDDADTGGDDGHGHDDGDSTGDGDGADDSHDDGHGHGPTTTRPGAGHDHGTTTTTHGDDGHGHDTTPTTHDDGHGHGPTTSAPGHEHPGGEDWAAIRLRALTGGLSGERVAEFRQKSMDFLSQVILERSATLAELPAAERQARLSAYVTWTVDHALEAENGHSHGPVPWKPVTDPAEQALLQSQLAAASTVIPKYPTAADAMADGYSQATQYIPGIASHYINLGLVDRTFDPAYPEMLLYNGNGPDSELVGVSYAMFGETPDVGFAGDNDSWHEHPQLCILGGFVVGPDHTPEDLCESIGANKVNIRLQMSHLWQVVDWHSDWGLFSGENNNVNMATSDLMR